MRKTVTLLLAAILLLAAAAAPAASARGGAVRAAQHLTYHKEPPAVEADERMAKEPDAEAEEDEDGAPVEIPDAETFSSYLPILLIDTEGQIVPGGGEEKEHGQKILCSFSLFDGGGSNTLRDTPAVESAALVGIRGHSSRAYPKKQYAVKLVGEDWAGNEQSLCGMAKGASYIVNGSYIDRTQIRNYLLYQVADAVMGNAPDARLCEMFLKDEDGKTEYMGLYTIIERIRVDRQHVVLTEFDPKRTENAALVQINNTSDHYRIERLMAAEASVYDYDLLYPDFIEMNEEQLHYVESVLAAYEKSLMDIDANPGGTAWMDRIDVDSFVDYFVINEFFQNYDAGSLSTFLYFDLDGVVHIGPVWDFDGAMNNNVGRWVPYDTIEMPKNMIYYYLCGSDVFTRLCRLRYQELRKTHLSEEYLLSSIGDCRAYLGGGIERNYARWYRSGEETRYDRRRGTVEEEFEKLEEHVIERGQWMDENIGKLSMLNG